MILRVDSLALWKIINAGDAVLIPKTDLRNFPADFCTRNFLGRGEPLCQHSIDCCLSPGHNDTTRFRSWSPIRPTGNHLDRSEKFQKLPRRLAPLAFLFRVQAFRGPLGGELPNVQIFMYYGPNPLKRDAQLLSY